MDNDIELPEIEDEYADLTTAERDAVESTEVALTDNDHEFLKVIINNVLLFCEEMAGSKYYPYQRELAYRIVESIIINDGETITALLARQSGKSTTLARTIAGIMVLFPRLAKIYPQWFGRFRDGVWVGAFAPVQEQADNLYGRIVDVLTSDSATQLLLDPEIDDKAKPGAKVIRLTKCKSFVRQQTAHPRAKIEGRTYHIILIDEAQLLDEGMLFKSIFPMKSSTNGTVILTGTPTYEKGVFYRLIQQNKKDATRRGRRQNHFQYDWKACAKANPLYGKAVKGDMLRMGENSDEFKLSYKLFWLFSQGMFTTTERMNELEDTSMQQLVIPWYRSPVVIGIDPARIQDSSVLTAIWVDWDRPDEFGYCDHRVLSWLDLSGMDWETQYYRMEEFICSYNVFAVGIDNAGVGDVVTDRLKTMMPGLNIVPLSSHPSEQTKRWNYLSELLNRGKIGWPGGAKVRRLRVYKKFRLEMEGLEKKMSGPYMMAQAPQDGSSHDDYASSLALGCFTSKEAAVPEVVVQPNPFYTRSR